MKLKKNRSGMTLVEVVIAMAYFSTATLGVCMALSAALRYTARNMRRDSELGTQQTAVERSTNNGVALNDGAVEDGNSLTFSVSTGTRTQSGITEYKALRTLANVDDFNFQVKGFSSTPLGNATLSIDKDNNEYEVLFTNTSNTDVTLSLDVSGATSTAYFFEGSNSAEGYKHPSSVYSRNVSKEGGDVTGLYTTGETLMDSEVLVGLYIEDLATAPSNAVIITVKDANTGAVLKSMNVGVVGTYVASSSSTNKQIKITYGPPSGWTSDTLSITGN